ncbi:topless-related protein 4-like isoform X4 [Ananas comosus]|uniref:Topless-related protein 4-like isoform X4 n=1 Tax=Ananas comosus TaxID=4615 RepID=A0A6P5FWU2_ANACO|nr:topless-related protein 4-like isoform X4 [Ananas comosus]
MPSPSHGGGGGGAAAASAPTSGASAGADGELFFLVHQYLVENNLHDTARMFERESGSFFSLRRFKRAVIAGDWDEAEWYVSGFTDVDSNPQSKKLIFELRRMKYFDTHDRMEGEKEMQILSNDLKLFDTKDALTTPPVRDMLLRRDCAFEELKGLIEKNHDFEGKLKEFPKLETRNLRTIFGAPLISTRGSRPPALAVHRGIQVQVMECENRKCFMNSPPAATFLALDAQEDNIIAIGRDDSSILIYNFTANEIIKELKGHHEKRVTGLAFSTELNVLISSGADAQLSKWGTHGWEHQGSKRLQVPTISAGRFARTKVQFHHDQVHLLVVHAAKLAIYDAAKLECLHQWCTPKLSRRYITHATYSCVAKMIYASFTDGCVGILTPSLELGCVIRPTAYLSGPSSDHAVFSVLFVYPLTIAAHPSEPMRFALGLSNGKVVILEPLESNRSWLNPPLSRPPPPLPKNTINGSSNAVEKTIPESR